MIKKERFEACILAGAIGDARGSGSENLSQIDDSKRFYLFGKPALKEPIWQITDDTQLTLATCEALILDQSANPEIISQNLLKLFRAKKLTGLGASTLQALRELDFGGHWSQVGRKGEYAAGNGAAMRIAPLAFFDHISNTRIREICWISHQNDEAYVGALAVVIAIRAVIHQEWTGTENLLEIIIDQIPDTRVRDRLIEINRLKRTSLEEIGQLGNNAYVVNSVPLAIAAANKVVQIGIEEMFEQLIKIGGDTDTNCSIAGQVAGTLIGKNNIPAHLLEKLSTLHDFEWIKKTVELIKKRIT